MLRVCVFLVCRVCVIPKRRLPESKDQRGAMVSTGSSAIEHVEPLRGSTPPAIKH
jgi:hypothetical protein